MTKKKDKEDEQRQAARPAPILFQNYDYTEEEPNETSPGGGLYHGKMDKYKSVKEFIEKRRKQNKAKVAILQRISEFEKLAK